ncbi:TRPM8 channel-associated factor homolog [Misgurnus anguillicaudatus]|uniref:TRPM8 channel-associated factor homolog n=1 Tax=Misgurnus anguillicaudatus TaxID=75329 RepID=UPI003CCF3215
MARENDYCTIMSGLSELDFRGNPVPNDLVLIGDHAFPLAMNPRGQVLMAASRYGQGRVVVLGHEDYLTHFPNLIENALMWLMACTGGAGIVGIQKNLGPVADNLCNSPVSTELGDFREGLAVYITDAYSVDACAKDLIAFLKAGGGLIIAGQAWHWANTHSMENVFLNFPGNKVCSVAGIYFTEHTGECGVFPVPSNIPFSWPAVLIVQDFKNDLELLLKGVPQFDIQGKAVASELMVHGPLAFPIAVAPPEKVFIAGAYFGQGRVIVLTHESYLGRESLSTFLINAINWLDGGRKGVVGIIPSLTGAQNILTKSGLNCQFTDLKKDLSVYVCTSYSDAQCEKIQEFVAEGGGLLIGGHAWYWAHKNHGHNVMTEYPGNRILKRMGLSILDNTVTGGVYKAPEITQSFNNAYHFRNGLRYLGNHVTKRYKLTPNEEGCLKQRGNDCASYLHMCTHDCASENDYCTIMSGLSELDFRGNAVPCDLVLIGDHAFPLAMNPRGQVLMAASRYGQGRVVVLGHEDYLTRFPSLIENALMWLMPCTGGAGIVGIQKNVGSVADNLCNLPVSPELGDFREGLAVYITDAYSIDACAKNLIAFVKAGGGLIIAGQAWHWANTHSMENVFLNFPGNKVCSVAGIYFTEHTGECGVFPVPSNIPSSWPALSIVKNFKNDLEFLLKGVSQFDIQGGAVASELMVHGLLAFPIAVTPSGQTFIAGTYYGQGRVIVLTHESYLGRESLSTFLINAINWLDEGRKGIVGIIPSLTEAQNILTKSGLNCQLTDLKKDLSVYVCTSYSDAECEKIQEFVAEGGGLLIGGHAWYWAYENCNVMTEYPGNRILNKMGLSILDNTVTGGLYKAPEIKQSFKDVCHFRNGLRYLGNHVTKGYKLTPNEEVCLKQLGNDCASYLRMRTHDCASYNSVVTLFTDMVKQIGVPQVCSTCPVKTPKDYLMLQIGTELYKTMSDPDVLLPYIIKERPDLPTVSNARVRISANTGDAKEWISTGLYLSPGMRTHMFIPLELLGKNWKVQIGCQTDNISAADVLKRAPVVYERFPLDKKMVQISNLWGGLIYLVAPSKTKVDGVEIVVQTAVKAPYFKSGETSVADWVGGIRQAPAPWAELEFENIIITLESSVIRSLDRPDVVAKIWDSIMRGIADLAAIPQKFPRKERFVADIQISSGFMHSGYPIMMHSTSAPELMNPKKANRRDLWGFMHELGHNQQRGVWEFRPHTTECTCNLWSVYVHEEVLGIDRATAHPNMTPKNRQDCIKDYVKGGRDLEKWTVWTALETYMQLQEKFGWDAFKKVFAAYHVMTGVPNNNPGKMNLYAETFSKVVNMNLSSFFKAWGWPIEPSTEQKISHLPEWSDHPMKQYE